MAIPPHERVLARVDKREDGCWIFTGALNHGGYGIVQLGRGIGTDRTHRVVYRALAGPIPEGATLDHLCFNTACCNPEHLQPVSRAENARRQWQTGHGVIYNSLKTKCPRGHAYTPENTNVCKNGKRQCKTCNRDRAREYQRRKRRLAKDAAEA